MDAVLSIVEHGNYPRNEKGQVLYPRHEFFKQYVDVFEKDGVSVPVYNDKHLSYSFEKAQWMVAASERLKFPMLAGSSLPVTWRLPDIELPLDCEIESALMVGNGESDAMDYHALEAMQCMVERRKGGETGVKAVEMIEGDGAWARLPAAPKQQLRDNAYTLLGQVSENRRPYKRLEAESIKTPTLFVGGGNTRGALPRVLRALAAHVPGAKTATIPGAGHWMFEQAPQDFCRIVLEFLASA